MQLLYRHPILSATHTSFPKVDLMGIISLLELEFGARPRRLISYNELEY